MDTRPLRGVVAEFIGAFALTFVGAAAILNTAGENLLAIALAHGLILAVTITAFMHISGGQFNPAVSIALALIGRQTMPRALAFCAAQLAGAVAAALILNAVFTPSEVHAVKLGATLGRMSSGAGANLPGVFALEAIATFFLMASVLGSAVDQRGVAKSASVGGFAIGLTLTASILAIGPLTGASLNPSRSFGPAFVGGYWDMHWVYWLAPILGAVAAALLWNTIMGGKREG